MMTRGLEWLKMAHSVGSLRFINSFPHPFCHVTLRSVLYVGEWRRREAGEWRVTDGSRRYATEGIIMWAVCLVTRPASRPSRLSLILHSIHSCRRRDVGEAKVREVEGGRDEGTARYTSLTPLVPRAVSVPSPTSLRSGSLRSLRYARWEGHEWWT